MCRLRTGPAASQPRGLDQTVQRGRFGSPPGPSTVHSVAAPFCAHAYTASFISAIFTVARWPKILQNNSKAAAKNLLSREILVAVRPQIGKYFYSKLFLVSSWAVWKESQLFVL